MIIVIQIAFINNSIYITTIWRKFLTGESIDEFDEFLSIRQHFPYQNFLLIIFCHLPARPFFVQGVIASICTHVKFSLSKYVYQYS